MFMAPRPRLRDDDSILGQNRPIASECKKWIAPRDARLKKIRLYGRIILLLGRAPLSIPQITYGYGFIASGGRKAREHASRSGRLSGASRKPALNLSKGTRISGHERRRRKIRAPYHVSAMPPRSPACDPLSRPCGSAR